MKLNFSVMIHTILTDRDGVDYLVLNLLNDAIKKEWPMVTVLLVSSNPYWKHEGERSIVYGLIHVPSLQVQDLLEKFPLTWECTNAPVYDIDSGKEFDYESAVWSKICNPEESFIDPLINWAHIYNWVE